MFAIIKNGGKQYWAETGCVLALERLEGEVGSEILLDAVSIGSKDKVTVGEKKVKATIIEHTREKKLIVFKKTRREHYTRKHGHKQHITLVKVSEI